MSEIIGQVGLNESNGIFYATWEGCYAAIVNPDGKRRAETYQVVRAQKINKKTYFLVLGEKIATASAE